MQDAQRISKDLDEIASLLEFSGSSRFKVSAYRRASQVVATLGDELGARVEQGRLRKFQGIGAALSRQIEEMWNSGGSELLARLRSELPEGAAELMQVEGLTPRRIMALQSALGVVSVEQLRAACAAEQVRTVPGFGAKTEARLAAAAQHWLEREQVAHVAKAPLLMPDALELAEPIRAQLLRTVGTALLAGALRRGEETVRELEFVIVGDPEQALREVAELRQVLRVDPADHSATLVDDVRLKLHSAEPSNLGNALLRATGSAAHVEAVMARGTVLGAENGVAFSERTFASERELYRAIECSFIPPELRLGKSELTEAAHASFVDLVELADIRGMVHCHTNYSDGKNTVEEMALAAEALGMEYLTITDHSPSAHYARGVALDTLCRAITDGCAALGVGYGHTAAAFGAGRFQRGVPVSA